MSRTLLLLLALAALAGAPLACKDEKVVMTTPSSADAGSDGKAPAGAGEAGGGSIDGSSDVPLTTGELPPVDCFEGTPKTHDELLNACWPDTVTAIYEKPKLPGGYKLGAPLPPPPP